jgi:uncharacterized RDD family membrane protein YckC
MLDTYHRVEVPEGIEIRLPLAGPVVRSVAFIIDFLIRVGIYVIAAIGFLFMGKLGLGIFFILVFLLEWFYPVVFEVLNHGATPGKKMMGIAVVNDDGTPVDWTSSIVRNLLRSADMLPLLYLAGLVSMFVHREFKRLGDLAAGTLVVHKKAFTQTGSLPEHKPKHIGLALTLEEQSALLHFGERSLHLSEARRYELADVLAPVVEGKTSEQRFAAILAAANWLRGRR